MGGRSRAESMVEQFTVDDKEFRESIKDSEEGRAIICTGLNVLNKCGNCTWRFKCATDFIQLLDRRENILEDGMESEDVAKGLVFALNYIQDKLSKEEQIELVEGIVEESGIELESILDALDEKFGDCRIYNDAELIVEGS